MELRPLDFSEDLASEYNSGLGFGLAVGSAVILLYALVPILAVALQILPWLLWS